MVIVYHELDHEPNLYQRVLSFGSCYGPEHGLPHELTQALNTIFPLPTEGGGAGQGAGAPVGEGEGGSACARVPGA